MELIRGTHKASNCDPKDFISIMPDIVVTNILDRLPLQDVVRTSILSTNWRFKWTLLSQLVFDFVFDNTLITSSCSIYELVDPKLQELHLDFRSFKFTQGAIKKRSPTFFPCLKALRLTSIDLANDIMLSCAFELIKCSTNLQTLAIETSGRDADSPLTIPKVEYNTIASLQLQTVVLRGLKGLESEVCLIKYILECSHFLKKIVIHHHWSLALAPAEKLLFTMKLLKLHRASPVAEFDLN